jgi:Zn-dependent oligopeptidase
VLRDTARSVEIEISKIMREFAYDEEIYQTFKKYFETNFKAELKNKILDDEAVKIVRDTEEGYKKMGMHLSKKDKKTLLQIKNKITKLASEYEKLATANYAKGQYFKKEELKGIPENIIQNFKFDEKKKKYFVRILPTEMSYVSKYCEIEDTRKKLAEIAALGVGDKNTKKLAEVLKLRNQMSKMVGYKTFAELAVSKEMVSSPREIDIFLKGLLRKLNPFFKKEKKKDLQILTSWQKKNLLGKRQSKKLQSWNWMFAENLSKENELKVKEEEYKPYFELENSIEVLFKIWKEFFNVGTEKVEGFEFFHKTERVYKFKDLRTGESLGYGVFDLFPREGKYGHACMNNVSHEKLIYLVCNFMQNTSGKNLLSFNDVVTLFHEAGHFLHFLLMKPKYQASRHVSNDFVEIPSQFFENFVMDENFVKENFKHFETGETMPDRLLKKVPKLSKKGEASAWVIQSMYSLFDQELHGKNTSKYFKNFKQIDKLFGGLYEKSFNRSNRAIFFGCFC